VAQLIKYWGTKMFDIDKSLNKMLGTTRKRGGPKDWDGDGVTNKKDCQPRNVMRQDKLRTTSRVHVHRTGGPGAKPDLYYNKDTDTYEYFPVMPSSGIKVQLYKGNYYYLKSDAIKCKNLSQCPVYELKNNTKATLLKEFVYYGNSENSLVKLPNGKEILVQHGDMEYPEYKVPQNVINIMKSRKLEK